MKHPTSRTLHAYWERLRGDRSAPERAEIEPGEIRHLLADSLILELDMAARQASVRLAGTRVCALYGRELRGTPFSRLWGPQATDPWDLVEIVAYDTLGLVAGLRGTNAAGESLDLELLLLPLRHRGRTQLRALGTLSPDSMPHWVGLRPLTGADTTSLRILGRDQTPRLGRPVGRPEPVAEGPTAPAHPAALARSFSPLRPSPLRRGHLLVHEGGRA